MEIEAQTHEKVFAAVKKPNNEIVKQYKSRGYDDVLVQQMPTPVTTNSVVDDVPASPTRPHNVVPLDHPTTSTSSKNACAICGSEEEKSFWLGCSHLNTVTKRLTCDYWVHQMCVGLDYRKRENLEKVPFYCLKHLTEKKQRKKKRTSSAPGRCLKRYASKKSKR